MSLKCPHKVNKGELLQGELRFSLILECLTIKRGCLYVLYVFFVFFSVALRYPKPWWSPPKW
jgi:cytochrome c oxidase subunit IV